MTTSVNLFDRLTEIYAHPSGIGVMMKDGKRDSIYIDRELADDLRKALAILDDLNVRAAKREAEARAVADDAAGDVYLSEARQ